MAELVASAAAGGGYGGRAAALTCATVAVEALIAIFKCATAPKPWRIRRLHAVEEPTTWPKSDLQTRVRAIAMI